MHIIKKYKTDFKKCCKSQVPITFSQKTYSSRDAILCVRCASGNVFFVATPYWLLGTGMEHCCSRAVKSPPNLNFWPLLPFYSPHDNTGAPEKCRDGDSHSPLRGHEHYRGNCLLELWQSFLVVKVVYTDPLHNTTGKTELNYRVPVELPHWATPYKCELWPCGKDLLKSARSSHQRMHSTVKCVETFTHGRTTWETSITRIKALVIMKKIG